jgi:hypothetical protein
VLPFFSSALNIIVSVLIYWDAYYRILVDVAVRSSVTKGVMGALQRANRRLRICATLLRTRNPDW